MSHRVLVVAFLGILPQIFPLAALAQKNLSGSARTRLAIERLNNSGKVLMIAAHPDDENTALLAYFARGRKMRTAYLSLTRGEGGQNLIGTERGDLMGVIRTQELLAARGIDGAEQFFTRAIDFGFSKTVEESLQKWDREQVLGDVVWTIRKFQPDVIILRFSGTPRDGHGQHQASAVLGKEAFDAAADPKRFPEMGAPWRAKRLMFNVFSFNREMTAAAEQTPGRIVIDTGEYNPVLGYSYAEIAGMSRSQHRSQGMGVAEMRGTDKQYLVTIGGEPAVKDPLEGIELHRGGEQRSKLLEQALQLFQDSHPERSIPLLLKARGQMPERDFDEAIAMCMGLFTDASASRPQVVPGTAFDVKVSVINRSPVAAELERVEIAGQTLPRTELANNIPYTQRMSLTLDRPYTQPYWLRSDKSGALYTVKDQAELGKPEGAPALEAKFVIRVAGETIELTRPVLHRYVDHVLGELTRPLVFVPAVTLRVADTTLLFPTTASRKVDVELKAWQANAKGSLRLDLPQGWRSEPASQTFQLAAVGEQSAVSFVLTPPAGMSIGDLRAVATVDGKDYASTLDSLEYPHIQPQAVLREASAKLIRTDIRVRAKQVGYVMGAGDEVPQALRQLGCEVTMLSADDLSTGDLRRFDAIVTGVRAYNTRADLRANQKRMMDYVEQGGTMVVQYNVVEGGFTGGDPHLLDHIGPYPMKHTTARVTVEEAAVTFPKGHEVFESPNNITAADFDGWVQERGLYFAVEWDPHYTSLMTSNDPGEKALAGGTLYTKFGKGVYIFSGYSWFRELPAGVPGAYRIFANFLSAGKVAK